jgi:hypothetical protein
MNGGEPGRMRVAQRKARTLIQAAARRSSSDPGAGGAPERLRLRGESLGCGCSRPGTEVHIQSACLGQASSVSTTSGGPPDSAEVAYRPR